MLKYREIFVGNLCDNKCLHCSYKGKKPLETNLNTILASLKEKGNNVLFYGGEPALRSDLVNIIYTAIEYGYRRIKLLTNGRSFSNINLLNEVINAGCYLFEIKLWGSNPSLHDYLTQSANSFRETIMGLENLAGLAHDKFVCIRIPVCKENYTDIENTVAVALNFGINRIILSVEDSAISLQTILPHLRNAINISIFNRTWIMTEGVPFCIMQGLEQHIGEIYHGLNTVYDITFEQHKYCIDCVYKEICPGAEAGYLKQSGGKEFQPVIASKYLKDIKALYE